MSAYEPSIVARLGRGDMEGLRARNHRFSTSPIFEATRRRAYEVLGASETRDVKITGLSPPSITVIRRRSHVPLGRSLVGSLLTG